MLYELVSFVIRPLRRWWRRALIAAIAATVVMPMARQWFDDTVTGTGEVTVPTGVPHRR